MKKRHPYYSHDIWCMRGTRVFFKVAWVEHEGAWHIAILGRNFWIGPKKPKFLGGKHDE